MRLIPKDAGGLRPILIFRTLYRLWARARVDGCRKWAGDWLTDPCWNNFGGRRPGDAVWRQLVQAEQDGDDDLGRAAVQLDISKMFDRVDHRLLVEAAARIKYPM